MSRCNWSYRWLARLGAFALLGTFSSGENLIARIKSDRVNLRARPDLSSEVVSQVNAEERLPIASLQNDWVEVIPPDHVDVWAHRDFVKDGTTTVKTLNLRAGPGINYSVVGTVSRGEAVTVRGQFGEWLKLAPDHAKVWVSREFVDIIEPLPSSPQPVSEEPARDGQTVSKPPMLEPAPAVSDVPQSAPESGPALALAPPADLNLVPLEGQGRQVRREGELKPAPFLFGRPSAYRLVRREGVQMVTVCYVRGNSAQLNSLMNETLTVYGREYWVQGVKQPVVVLERIERRAP